MLVIDCKCLGRRIDVKTVESFIGLVQDAGADRGLLVTTKGASEAARRRDHAGTLDLEVVTLDQLVSWSPRDTVGTTVAIAASEVERATTLLEKAGLRVRHAGRCGDEAEIEVFRHYPGSGSDANVQASHHNRVYDTLGRAAIPHRTVSTGVTIDGGTPAHRWIPVAQTPAGPLKVLASSQAELEQRVEDLERALRAPRQSASND
jgi:hypothetical protein